MADRGHTVWKGMPLEFSSRADVLNNVDVQPGAEQLRWLSMYGSIDLAHCAGLPSACARSCGGSTWALSTCLALCGRTCRDSACSTPTSFTTGRTAAAEAAVWRGAVAVRDRRRSGRARLKVCFSVLRTTLTSLLVVLYRGALGF